MNLLRIAKSLTLVLVLSSILTTKAVGADEIPAGIDPNVLKGIDTKKISLVEFKRSKGQTRLNVEAGPFAFGPVNTYGLHVGGTLEYWDLDRQHIQSIGGSATLAGTTVINIAGAMFFEALPRLYAGARLGMVWGDKSGFAALSTRLVGSDPDAQRFFSILYTQIDLGLKSGGSPFGSIVFGFKLF
jgi:hypothetical protein